MEEIPGSPQVHQTQLPPSSIHTHRTSSLLLCRNNGRKCIVKGGENTFLLSINNIAVSLSVSFTNSDLFTCVMLDVLYKKLFIVHCTVTFVPSCFSELVLLNVECH